MPCQKCGQGGHNRRTCPESIQVVHTWFNDGTRVPLNYKRPFRCYPAYPNIQLGLTSIEKQIRDDPEAQERIRKSIEKRNK
jgi:hypothetical protein